MNPKKKQTPKKETHQGAIWDGPHEGPRDTCSKCNYLVGKMFGNQPKGKK